MGVIYDTAYCVRTFLNFVTLKTAYLLAHCSLLADNISRHAQRNWSTASAVGSESNEKHIWTQNWEFDENGEKL